MSVRLVSSTPIRSSTQRPTIGPQSTPRKGSPLDIPDTRDALILLDTRPAHTRISWPLVSRSLLSGEAKLLQMDASTRQKKKSGFPSSPGLHGGLRCVSCVGNAKEGKYPVSSSSPGHGPVHPLPCPRVSPMLPPSKSNTRRSMMQPPAGSNQWIAAKSTMSRTAAHPSGPSMLEPPTHRLMTAAPARLPACFASIFVVFWNSPTDFVILAAALLPLL
ncbi:hypothetical protein IWZ00DRAFT_362127 [Phyllosticta capitalensis]